MLSLLAVSSAVALVAIPANYHPTYFIRAERLGQQPETYFVLENPDSVVSQAISNPQESVEILSLEDTQIDELIDEYDSDPFNVKVNDSYFRIGIVCADNFPPPLMSLLYLVSPVTLLLSLTTITIILVITIKQKANG